MLLVRKVDFLQNELAKSLWLACATGVSSVGHLLTTVCGWLIRELYLIGSNAWLYFD